MDLTEKTCKKCGHRFYLSAFKAKNGCIGSDCRLCRNAYSRAHYAKNIERNREYWRAKDRTPERRASLLERQKKHRERHGNVNAACRTEYTAALSDGRLTRPGSCEFCGKECKPDGHHDDHCFPLNVLWLCKPCHSQRHIELRRQTERP